MMNQKIYNEILESLKENLKDNLISLVLFGSHAREEAKEHSDIDLLIICKDLPNLEKLQDVFLKYKIQPLVLTKEKFKKQILMGNSQLIPIFYEGKTLYDKDDFFEKNKRLFILLHKEKDIKVKYKNKTWTMKKLVMQELF